MRAALLALMLATAGAVEARGFLVVVAGIGGEPAYSERFRERAERMLAAAGTRLGLPRERVVYLAEQGGDGADGLSAKGELAAALARVGAAAEADDTVMVLLIGHGSTRADAALFNLPGPDVSAAELDALLAPLAHTRVAVVNTAPASAGFVETLSAPGRVVVSATASAAERYHTSFADHFIAAYAGEGADADKSGRVSLREAFAYAAREVERAYRRDGRLQTEHALLDDDGDGRGSLDVAAEGADGAVAASLYLESVDHVAAVQGADPALLAARERLAAEVTAWVQRKAELDAAHYAERLEALLVELALTQRALDGGGGLP